MKACVIIPARLESTRLPHKVLADINGKPMIVRVWEQAEKANVGPVIIACDDREIYEAVNHRGGSIFMTDRSHLSGSDRIFEALQKFDPAADYDVVINLQGDMPFIQPSVIKKVLAPLKNPDVDIATIVHPIKDKSELETPSVVKAVLSIDPKQTIGRAIYFTRNSAPYGDGTYYHHQGIYAYRREALKKFVSLNTGWLEEREKLEQLRALENGMRIDAVVVKQKTISVDTQEDLDKARRLAK